MLQSAFIRFISSHNNDTSAIDGKSRFDQAGAMPIPAISLQPACLRRVMNTPTAQELFGHDDVKATMISLSQNQRKAGSSANKCKKGAEIVASNLMLRRINYKKQFVMTGWGTGF